MPLVPSLMPLAPSLTWPGIFWPELTDAAPLTSSFTAFAFFVVLRVLIKLFFSIVMAASPR